MLLALVPETFIAALICPRIDSESMLLVILVLPFIHPTVIPYVDAHTLHVVVQPLTLILAAIQPRVDTDPRDLVLSPVASIHRTIVPLIAANAMFATKCIITIVARLIGPGLYAVTMLEVIFPHAFVLGAIYVFVDSSTISLVVGPVAIVDVAIDMDKASLAMSSIFTPLSTIFRSIVPRLLAKSITEAALPLTGVHGSSFERISGTLFSLLIRVVSVLGDCLASFLLGKVFAAPKLLCSKEADESSSGMSTPESLELDNLFHLRLQKPVIISIICHTTFTILIIKALCTVLSSPTQPLELRRLAVHIEFGMLTILAHTVGAISLTISH